MGNTLTQLEDSVSKAVSHFTLEVVQPRVISFEDQVAITAAHWLRNQTCYCLFRLAG